MPSIAWKFTILFKSCKIHGNALLFL